MSESSGPLVTGHVQIGAGDIRDGWLRSTTRTQWIIYAGVALLILLQPLLLTHSGIPVLEAYFQSWPLLALIPVWIILFLLLIGPIAAWRMSPEQKNIRYDINSESVRITDGLGATIIIPWTMVTGVRASRKGYALLLKPRGVRWIPARSFDAQNAGAFRALILGKGF